MNRFKRGFLLLSGPVVSVALLVSLTGCANPGLPARDVGPNASEIGISKNDDPALIVCMRERGWGLTLDGNGYTIDLDNAQIDAYYADLDTCQSELPVEDPLTDEQYRRLYELLIGVAECLAERGYETHPPEMQVFVDSKAEWNPYAELSFEANVPASELVTVEKSCPQPTSDELLLAHG